MKFDGMLEAALPDAEIAANKFFQDLHGGSGVRWPDLKKLLAEFAKAGYNYMGEAMREAQKAMMNFPFEMRLPESQEMKDSMAKELAEEFKKNPPKTKKYPGPYRGYRNGPNLCNEIPLAEQGVCNLATGKLEVQHTTCQHCGEVVSPIGVDRFGHKQPEVHASSFGWSSEYFPINATVRPLMEGYQAEDRLHRRSAEVRINLSEAELLQSLRNKEKVFSELNFRCQCGESVTAFYTDAAGEHHICKKSSDKLLSLDDEEYTWLIRHFNNELHPNLDGTPFGNMVNRFLVKLTKMESSRAEHKASEDRQG